MGANHIPASGLDGLLGPEGPIAHALTKRFDGGASAYEERPQQLRMACAVAAALSSGRHALVEAGTGVGKSFAYLVPLLQHAEATGKTVAVATSTIALQEQLVRKDLPLLEEALPFEVSYALVKGRGNYVCLRRMDLAADRDPFAQDDEEAASQLAAIRAWSLDTRDGSRQDLPFRPARRVWDRVKAERGNCMGRQCRHYEACHYQRSRRRAHAARLLVLNHHVLMADLALRRSGASFLPPVDAIVIDEAHDLEDTAAEHLGTRVSSLGVLYQLGRLWNRRKRGLLRGHRDNGLRTVVDQTRAAALTFFRDIEDRLASGRAGTVVVEDGVHIPDALSPRLAELSTLLRQSTEGATNPEVGMELGARARGLGELALSLAALARDELDGQVRWFEGSGRGGVSLHAAPVDVGLLLQQVLWDRHPSVILTSATLCAGKPASFEFLSRRLGLPDADTEAIGSPFEYGRQARVAVQTDMPDPGRAPDAYARALPHAVHEAVQRTRGGAFVLFTSIASMRSTADALRERLEGDGYRVLVQGETLERPALLDAFRDGGAVLFGVSSFWQGVDVPGDALRHVIITRLPFEVPSHPLQAARARRVRETGGDAFRDLSLPTAALRLKQGFGRLIRHTNDEGMVTLLDSRIVTKAYGRYLLDSLPECPVELLPESDPA